MSLFDLMAFAVVAFLLVASPGPNGLLIAKTVPTAGKAAGFANIAGFVTAFVLHGTLSILGISVILMKSSEAFFIVKTVGAMYLAWIGVKALVDAFRTGQAPVAPAPVQPRKTLFKAYVEGFLTNALNPKVSMFYLAAFPQFMPVGEGALLYAVILVCIHASINAVWFTLTILVLSSIKALANKVIIQKLLKVVTGIIFIGFGGKLAMLQAQ